MIRRSMMCMTLLMALTLAGSSAGAHDHAHHDHDEVSHRVFAWAESGEENRIVYIDLLAHTIHDWGIVETDPYTEALVSEHGRFLALFNQPDRSLQVLSSGLVLQEHGGHYDLTAMAPRLFWEHTLGRSPQGLTSGGQDFLIADAKETVSWLRSDDGLQIVFPDGTGPLARSNTHVAVADRELRLLDLYDAHHLRRRASLRLADEPQALALTAKRAVVLFEHGLQVFDLDSLETTVYRGLWTESALDLWVRVGEDTAYVLLDAGVAALDLSTGHHDLRHERHTGLWAVNQDGTYLAVVDQPNRVVSVLAVSEDGLQPVEAVAIAAEAPIAAVTWAGRDFAALAGSKLYVFAFDGRVRDQLTLPFPAAGVGTAFIPAEERVMHHHHEDDGSGHDEHHEHHKGTHDH